MTAVDLVARRSRSSLMPMVGKNPHQPDKAKGLIEASELLLPCLEVMYPGGLAFELYSQRSLPQDCFTT